MDNCKRTTLIVDRKVQFALVLRIFVHWCLFVFCSVALNIVIFRLRSPHLGWGECLGATIREQLPFLIVSLFLLPVFLLDTVKLSHRFVGPIVRFRGVMSQIVAGEKPSELNFRPGDFWHEISNDFSTMARRLQSASMRQDANN